MLEHMIAPDVHASPVRKLAHMIAPTELHATLETFLISCRVDELSPRTIVDYQQKVSSFIRFAVENSAAAPPDVTTHHVRLFLLSLQDRCSAITVKDYYTALHRFFNWLVAEGVIEVNPMAKIRKPRVPQKIINTFTDQHIMALLKMCDTGTFTGLRNRAMVIMLIDTGLRLSELASIQLGDIDIEHGLIKVMGKGAKERFVAFGKRAQKAVLKYLLARHDDHTCLWVTEERQPMQSRGIQIMIRRLGQRAELQGVRCSPHTFRHTFATRSLLNGGGQRFVQSLLGHSSGRMTENYIRSIDSTHATEAHKKFSPVDRMKL